MGPVVSCEGVSAKVRGKVVVEGVDLEVRAGEVLGLIGPNGGGKSTLLFLMAGLVTPSSGKLTVCGSPAQELAAKQTGKVGLITAEPGLYPLLTGRENLRFFGSLCGLGAAEVDKRTGPLVARLELDDAALDRPSAEYSSGMRQKVSLLRALLLSPALLLLDEPSSNLDPVATRTLYGAVRAQADQGVAVVLCTHDLRAASRICDRVAVLSRRLLRVADVSRDDDEALYRLYTAEVGSG